MATNGQSPTQKTATVYTNGVSHDEKTSSSVSSPDEFQILKSFIDTVKTLSLDTTYESASKVLDEKSRLRDEIRGKDEELLQMKEKLEKVQTTVDGMFEMNRTQKSKHESDLERISVLESTIKENETKMTHQVTHIDLLSKRVKELQASNDVEKASVEKATREIGELKEEVKKKDNVIETHKAGGQKAKQAYKAMESKAKELEKEKEIQDQNLQQTSAKLHELENYALPCGEEDEDGLLTKFFSLWETASKTLVVHLKEDLPTETLQNYQMRKMLRMLKNDKTPHHVPLPQTNSEAAKQMRLAIILAILAREINDQIFQPTYLFSPETDFRDVLYRLALTDQKKESFCRAILLSIEPEKQEHNLEERKRNVVKTMESYLEYLASPLQLVELRKCLEDIVQQAAETWRPFQGISSRYEPDFEDDSEWDQFEFATETGTADGRLANGEIDETALVIFPRLCLVGDNQRRPRNYVTVLRKSQCVVAEQELRRKELPSPTSVRNAGDRQRGRTMSISLTSTGSQSSSFLGSPN